MQFEAGLDLAARDDVRAAKRQATLLLAYFREDFEGILISLPLKLALTYFRIQ
jgi:hypothetical protein